MGVLLNQFRPDVIVCEAFKLYAHKAKSQIGSEFPSVRVIGMIETYLHEYKMSKVSLVFQAASVRSKVKIVHPSIEVLSSPHIKDAYRHLRYYLLTTNLVPR